MENRKSDKRLCEVSVDDYRALGDGEVAARIMERSASSGVPMYGVRLWTNSASFVTEESKCGKLLKIAEAESRSEGSPKPLSVRKDLGLVILDGSKLPMGAESFLYLVGALSDCGIRILGIDVKGAESMITVAYEEVERAQRIIEQIAYSGGDKTRLI